jgi:hypothetical protein
MTNQSHSPTTAAAICSVLSLAACSSSNSPTRATTNTSAALAQGSSTNSSTNPSPAAPTNTSATAANSSSCGLVTASEVSSATGKAMGQGADAGTICSYSATADPSTVVYVQLYTDAQSMDAAKATEPGSQHLPGLDDDAFWTAAGTAFVQKGSRGFTISIPSLALTSPSAPKALLTLAKIAADRL